MGFWKVRLTAIHFTDHSLARPWEQLP